MTAHSEGYGAGYNSSYTVGNKTSGGNPYAEGTPEHE
jgi:hypothetical protein|tara:strand:+ start:15984 stop:16094 length:111 start_codon:yes stop_codon:yes gene_type:complete